LHELWSPEHDRRRLECLHLGQRELREHDRVRLRLHQRSDIFDLAIDGKLATIDTIEEDLEGRVMLAVTIDDDPGRDLGRLRQPGHRFFVLPDEIDPLEPQEKAP
jgi:hypothetical protein